MTNSVLAGSRRGWRVVGVGVWLLLAGCSASRPPAAASGENGPVSVLLVGCSHLAQLYKADNPHSDMLTARRQAELAQVRAGLERYHPDAILVEELPERQAHIDSLYQRYRAGTLDLATLPGGRSEIYQLGFALGRAAGVPRITCVNAPGGTSQSILHEGRNIGLYEQATARWRDYAKPFDQQLLAGATTMPQYLRRLNDPATVRQLHTLVYRTPARVTDGRLRADPMVDTAFLSPHYVGAEFISVFYNRDLKIYSNLVTAQLAARSQRLLVLIGVRHVGSLQGILGDDPAYRVVPAARYLGRD